MVPTSTGLARVTIVSAQRRVDVALPDGPPLAELLPELLAHLGVDLADDGERHGGWLLRRADGAALTESSSLAAQGVRDGAVLHLVPALGEWPELEYDDVVEAIAAGARRRGSPWSGSATRVAGLLVGGIALGVGLVGVLRAGPPWSAPAALALAVAGVLLLAGGLAARAYGDAVIGVVLGGYALPYAFAGGLVLLGGPLPVGRLPGPPQLLVGSVALLLAAVLGAMGVGHGRRLFAAGATAGAVGGAGALLGFVTTGAGAAAVVLTALVTGAAAVPLLAIRLGRLPMPPIGPPAPPASSASPADGGSAPVDGGRVFAAVARTDEILTGMLTGLVPVGVVAAVILVRSGGVAGRVLVTVAAVAFLLRARLFATVRQRLPLLALGVGGFVPLAVVGLSGARSVVLPGVAVLVVVAVVVAAAGGRYAHRAPSPYLGRAADLLDALGVVSVLPVACAVLGLFARIRELVS